MTRSSAVCRRARTVLVLGFLLAWTAGCGGPRMPKTHPLKGRVVFKGGQPVSQGSLAFSAETPEGRWHGSAALAPDGTFTEVMTVGPDNKPAPGLVEGEHRVRIDLGRGGDAGEGRPRVRLPGKYQDFDKSGWTVRIPAPNHEATFEVDPAGP